jgi:hypothetical protein
MSKENKNKLAKFIRAVAIPPTFVSILTVSLYFLNPNAFRHVGDLIVTITSLALLPILAYPLAKILPPFKEKGRTGSRSLAFITSAIGYIVGTLYAFISGAANDLKFIFCGYLFALIFLTAFNKILKLKASGHACGILGPLLYAVYFFGLGWLIPCAAVGCAVVWASVYRGSHTPKELLLGGMCAIVGFCIGLI